MSNEANDMHKKTAIAMYMYSRKALLWELLPAFNAEILIVLFPGRTVGCEVGEYGNGKK